MMRIFGLLLFTFLRFAPPTAVTESQADFLRGKICGWRSECFSNQGSARKTSGAPVCTEKSRTHTCLRSSPLLAGRERRIATRTPIWNWKSASPLGISETAKVFGNVPEEAMRIRLSLVLLAKAEVRGGLASEIPP